MRKYIIRVYIKDEPNAGTKSRKDLEMIALKNGYELLLLRKRDIEGKFKFIKQLYWLLADFLNFFIKIKMGSILMIISPLPFSDRNSKYVLAFFNFLRSIKKIKISAVLMDINKSRYNENVYDGELIILESADYIIAHNEKMKEILIDYGFNKDDIIPIDVFDYITDYKPNFVNKFLSKEVVFAGNLEPAKAGFIYILNKLKEDVCFNIYGGNYEGKKSGKNFKYKGIYSTEEIVENLESSFGLVWDGYSIETCSGLIGEYLSINNPHKTSMYLVAGLPVIIWDKAALADFITEKNLGFIVGSLDEIDEKINGISEEDYRIILDNVKKEADKISKGWYFKKAFKEIENRIVQKNNN